MLSIDEALKLVLEKAQPLPPVRCAADEALGRALAQSVASDIDSPPHDKSIVDGYVVIAADTAQSGAELSILEEITAGQLPTCELRSGTASRIMTGAPLPAGADAVVMVEKTELLSADRVRILQSGVRVGQNIMRRASSLGRGQTVLEPGAVLRAIEIGLLHEVGCVEILTHPLPRVAVLATGNELVSADRLPASSQIRNSNGPMLTGLVHQAGGRAVNLGIGRDDSEQLRKLCQRGMECDVLVVSGGVSAGVLDLVPAVLESLGVEQLFHKVNLKPGKPLWFGAKHRGGDEGGSTLVFGLPGNPVSSLVCFELFVRSAIARLAGRMDGGPVRIVASLSREHHHQGGRVTMFPASLRREDGDWVATPLDWRGSGDLRTLTEAQGLIHFTAGERHYGVGDQVDVLLL